MHTKFPMTHAEIDAASGYDLTMALVTFWRVNGMRQQNLTDGEKLSEAHHWRGEES